MISLLEQLSRSFSRPPASPAHWLRSCQCTQAQLQSAEFKAWAVKMKHNPEYMHRKLWEYSYVTQALFERGLLAPGKRGLGFAVGQEPLSPLFANHGCDIMATDLAPEDANASGWIDTSQHATSVAALDRFGLCDPALLQERVQFRFVDMRQLPADLGQYDFIWSCCSLEHLGTLGLGEMFIFESLKYLKPGGVAVHTTEYNVHSNTKTIQEGGAVIYRRRDFQRMAAKLNWQGYRVELDFTAGELPYDLVVDEPPYKDEPHLKLLLDGFVATSFGLIIAS
jgi:2-polyprenyl-3-methyl-5-hydroxy-6-metoxy-1,4-benzoquinol methylase